MLEQIAQGLREDKMRKAARRIEQLPEVAPLMVRARRADSLIGSNPNVRQQFQQLQQQAMQSQMDEVAFEQRRKAILAPFAAQIAVIDSANAAITSRFTAEDTAAAAWPDSIRQRYLREGGAPYLDQQYTVFGRVVRGLEVVERIGSYGPENDPMGKPTRRVTYRIKVVE
jgi:cyclophilin family peptidyl-prolyl cis-trans isomerase